VTVVKRIESGDPRPFADVTILGRNLKGLLDTGASVGVLNRDCRELVEA